MLNPAALPAIAKGAEFALSSLPILGDLFGRRQQQSFQERMANTTYQRAVRDMRKAGLNPMLAYKQGGAPAPGGASTSSAGQAVAAGVSSVLQLRRQKEELANMQAQRRHIDEQTKKTRAETTATDFDNEKRRVISSFWKLGGKALETFNEKVESEGMANALVWGAAFLLKNKIGGKGKAATKKVLTRRGTRKKGTAGKIKKQTRKQMLKNRARRDRKIHKFKFDRKTGEIYGE